MNEVVQPQIRRRLAMLGGTTARADWSAAFRLVHEPQRLVHGPAIAAYERAFADSVGVAHAVSFATGRVGLYGLLRALDIGEGDDVLLQVPTHIVVANAIRYTGARPLYADCELETLNLDLEDAEQRVTPRTRVLVLQHTFGIPVDLERALAFAKRHDLVVIEDCVHSLGARYRGRPVGGFGRAAFFSSEETKTISTTMGGMVVTDDAELAASMRAFQARCAPASRWLAARYVFKLLAYHVLTEPRVHRYARELYDLAGRRNPLPVPVDEDEMRGLRPVGYERRLSNAQAALGLSQLSGLEANLSHRRQIAALYTRLLQERGRRTPAPPRDAEPAYVRYPVWVESREVSVRALAPYTVVGTWFTSVLEEAVSPQHGDYEPGSCPRAEEAARHLINLPTHTRVREADAERLVAALP